MPASDFVPPLMEQEGLILKKVTVGVPAGFRCDLEIYDRAKFQAAGHYVLSTIRGERVYILTLRYKDEQVLRCQGSTMNEATEDMGRAISQTFFALWTAEHQRTSMWSEVRRLGDERNRLVEFLAFYYPDEYSACVASGGDIYGLALQYLRKERGRFWVRLANLFRRKRGGHSAPPTDPPTQQGA
jgi:hypothetical protein